MFEVVALEGCPYSKNAVQVLEPLGSNVIWVNDTTKQKYKTAGRETFPQIFYHVKTPKGQKRIYVGGWNDLENLIAIKNELKKQYGEQIIAPFLHLFLKQ